MYYWKDWLKRVFIGIDPITHILTEYKSNSFEPHKQKVWRLRDKLKISDPKEPPLEENKEFYINSLNKHYNNVIKTCSVIVVDCEFKLTDYAINELTSFLNSNSSEFIVCDTFNEKHVVNKDCAKLALDTIEKTIKNLQEEFKKNIEIVNTAKSGKELFFNVYFMNYYPCESILDYVE